MPTEDLPEVIPDHRARLTQGLEGKTPDINAIVDAIAEQIGRIAREIGSAVPHAAETLWNAAHAVAAGLPPASNCALDAVRKGVRQAESGLYNDLVKPDAEEAPGPGTRQELITFLAGRRRARG